MLYITYVLIITICKANCEMPALFVEEKTNLNLCVSKILQRLSHHQVTYVDIHSQEEELIRAIHSMKVLVLSREATTKATLSQKNYLIRANTTNNFLGQVSYLLREFFWRPWSHFIVVIDYLELDELESIFSRLLSIHVYYALVLNGTNSAEVFSYNPFENYGCGRRFDEVIQYGECLKSTVQNLYPNIYKNGLRNCTFNVGVSHMPPYDMDPEITGDKTKEGEEQYAFRLLSEMAGFKYEYFYSNFSETVSVVDENMTATGILRLIQTGDLDIEFGFMIATDFRLRAFDTIHGHLAFTDELTYVVKKSGQNPLWKSIYLEFSSIVWGLLAFTFIICSIVITILVTDKDKWSVVLKMFSALLLQHGYVFKSKFTAKLMGIFWLWFCFLVNSFYQSSLVSLTTHPSIAYQISSEEDLQKYRYNSCVSRAFNEFIYSVSGHDFGLKKGCYHILESLETVSKSKTKFTILPLSIFNYNKHLFYDEFGDELLYHFPKPLNKIMYSMYMYKGFPMLPRFHRYTLTMRESGLMDKHFDDLVFRNELQHSYKVKYAKAEFKARLLMPWYILVIGSTLAIIVFVWEVFHRHKDLDNVNKNRK